MWVARRPPGYAFIDFDDRRDAQDAIRDIDGELLMLLFAERLSIFNYGKGFSVVVHLNYSYLFSFYFCLS